MTDKPSSFIWYELMTDDIDGAAEFYGTVVGWTAQGANMPGMDYRLWSIGETSIGGLMAIPAAAAANGMRPVWLGYVAVADVDTAVADVIAAGGSVHMPATDIPGVGRMALVADPQGAALYVMTPIGVGPSIAFAPGKAGHGGWHELHTSDWPAAFSFYGRQLGWEKVDEFDMGPMGLYLLFGQADGAMLGGMMNNPGFPRPMWLYYFNVDDIDTARQRVQDAGGSVVTGPHQVPGGQWMIQARDPQGALFGLLGPPRA